MSEVMPPDALLALMKAILGYLRECSRVIGTTSNLDLFARSYLVLAVVAIGEEEGRPVTVPDVVNYTGMARTTVQRELRKLIRHGILCVRREGRRKVILRHPDNRDATYQECMRVTRSFIDAVSNILPKS